METFYVKKYINFFKECESLFLNGEIEKKIDYENKMSERDHCQSPKNLSFHFSDEGNLKSPRSTSFKLGILKKKTKNSLIISPNKVNNQSLNIDERLSIVRNIFQFFKDHPLGLEDLIKKILKVYSDLIIRSNSLSGQYEEISALVFIFLINKFKIIYFLQEKQKKQRTRTNNSEFAYIERKK